MRRVVLILSAIRYPSLVDLPNNSEQTMKKPLTKLVALASVIASMSVAAGENYNYSHLTAGAAFIKSDSPNGQKIDETGFLASGAYEFETIPLIINAGYIHSSVNDDERSGVYGNSYYAGAGVVFSPTDRLDIVPGFAVGSAKATEQVGAIKEEKNVAFYNAAVDVRFHLERGLWLTTGLAYQKYDDKARKSKTLFDIGAEYVVSDTWSLGIDFQNHSDGHATTLFGKVFY